jgi:hypothetical protein
MINCHFFDPVDGKQHLEIYRLLRPEVPVIIEYGNPVRYSHEMGTSLLGYVLHKVDDPGFNFSFIS